jgi:hypothetical protein
VISSTIASKEKLKEHLSIQALLVCVSSTFIEMKRVYYGKNQRVIEYRKLI